MPDCVAVSCLVGFLEMCLGVLSSTDREVLCLVEQKDGQLSVSRVGERG